MDTKNDGTSDDFGRHDARLGDLADELLLAIIEQIDCREALKNLASTSLHFQALAEPFIWRSLLVTQGTAVPQLAYALSKRPERTSAIWDLAVRYNEKDEDGIELLNFYLPRMEKLRNLTIESPCPNNFGRGIQSFPDHYTKINYTKLFEDALSTSRQRPLPILQSRKQFLFRQALAQTDCDSHSAWP